MRKELTEKLAKARPSGKDATFGVLLFLAAMVELHLELPGGPGPALWAAAALITLPLVWRRRFPLTTAFCVLGTFVAYYLLTGTQPPAMGDPPNSFVLGACWIVAVYSSAAHSAPKRAPAGLALGGAAALVFTVLHDPGSLANFLAATLSSVVVPWLAGAFRGRQVRQAELEKTAARLRQEAEEGAERAAAEERLRIARELHDVVAHGVSLMVVQAEAGQALLSKDPKKAGEAFESIQQTGRHAMTELRRLLGVMRPANAASSLIPQPGVGDISRLAEQVTDSGLPVELNFLGDPVRLPAGLDLCAYRVVQEGLTNALKHARAKKATVQVTYGANELLLEVSDDGMGVSDRSPGYGLFGLEERVRIYGGELEAGSRSGGFCLRARLPVQAEQS